MSYKKLMNGLLALALMGAVFTALVPTAAAQGTAQPANLVVTLDSQGADQQLKPLQAPIELKGTITLTADSGAPRSSLTGITVSLTPVQQPSWATLVISPPQIVLTFEDAPSGTSQTVGGTFKVLVSASDQAPAFQDAPVVVEAKSSSTPFLAQQTSRAPASIRASYFSIIDVALPESIKVERPQTPVSFPISVTNLGNGPTKVNFELLNAATEGDKLQIAPPQSLTLEARQTGGSQITKDAILQVQTPFKNGYMNEPRAISMKISSHYATDTQLAGQSETVTVLVTTKGFYVPGPSPLLLIGLVGIAAVLFRQLRK